MFIRSSFIPYTTGRQDPWMVESQEIQLHWKRLQIIWTAVLVLQKNEVVKRNNNGNYNNRNINNNNNDDYDNY